MAVPTTRQEFKEYCLRKAGFPVIEINVTDEQLEDRIDEALRLYKDYHFDGTERKYYAHQITQTDKTNRYIVLPNSVIGVTRVFPPSSSFSSKNLFDIRYQIALNDIYQFATHSLIPYYLIMRHIELLQELLVGEKPIRYNRHTNKLYIDMNWNEIEENDYIVAEVYEEITNADIWSDLWLTRYTTALFKLQFAQNISKYKTLPLPGGMELNSSELMQLAIQEEQSLREELKNSWSLPAYDFIG